jgi:hypothetical protein
MSFAFVVRAASVMQTPLRPGAFSDNRVPMERQTALSEKPQKRRGPAPTGIGTLIGVRLLPPNLSALDAWIAAQPEPRPSRPQAIRLALRDWLASQSAAAVKSPALPPPSDTALEMPEAKAKARKSTKVRKARAGGAGGRLRKAAK